MTNPIPGWSIGREDDGVDASAPPGTPYYCPASCRRIGPPIGGWLPFLYLFQFDPPLSGTYQDCQYLYVAEGVTPPVGSTFRTGQVMCRSSGTSIETGWGSPTNGTRTLANGAGAANPAPPAASTPWGASFKSYFGIGGGQGHVTPGMVRPQTAAATQGCLITLLSLGLAGRGR